MKILLNIFLALASLQAFGQEKDKEVTSQTISLQLQSWSMISFSPPANSDSVEIQSGKDWVSTKTLSSTDLPYQNSKADTSLGIIFSSSMRSTSSVPFTFLTVSPE